MTPVNVVIIGAGPAGTRAALQLAVHGIRPIVIDEQERSGGQIYRRANPALGLGYEQIYGSEHRKAKSLHDDFDAAVVSGAIDYRPRSTAWAVHENFVYVEHDGTHTEIDYDRLLIATGAVERIIPLGNWTLPGVFTLGGAQIALKAQGCGIGRRTAFVGTGPLLYLVAYQYAKAGGHVVGVFDTSTPHQRIRGLTGLAANPRALWRGIAMMVALKFRYGVALYSGVQPLAAIGPEHVCGFRYSHSGLDHVVPCDAIGVGYGLRPEIQFADLAGCHIDYDPIARNWIPRLDEFGRTSISDVYVAGDAAGIAGADAAETRGRLAAQAIIADIGSPRGTAAKDLAAHRRQQRFKRGLEASFPPPVANLLALSGDTVLCRCEGVTIDTFRHVATATGAREINRAKSLSRCGMGRCQGRFCEFAASEILADLLKKQRSEVGRLRAQPPVKPISSAKGAVNGNR